MLQTITTKPGDKYRSLRNPKVYEALRRRGMSKERAARISNAQKRHKGYTLDQLERFVSSDYYDPTIAQAIALGVPELPRLKGEQISPGVTRIRGNLCNVHGKYGPCDKALSGKKPKKGRAARKPAKAAQTPEQRARASEAKRQARLAEQAKRQQDAAGRRSVAQMGRELAKRQADAAKRQQAAQERAQAKPKPAKAGGSDKKKPAAEAKPAPRRPIRMPQRAGASPSAGGSSSAPKPKPKPSAPKPEKQQPAVASPALTEAAQRLSDGAELSDADTGALIRNGLARLVKGELVLTATGQRAIRTKETSFRVFKDASGRYRWVAQSSTAYQDRDQEIVSTKALSDDCDWADQTGNYGPLRWWHSPGLDLGDCDFNAMHGRVLIESGTFFSETIAVKVARASAGLEISLGFLHPPTEPDADGVFHHIRRFERSLVPRGRASNRFTAFAVKESQLMDATKVAALKTLGFSDADIADIEARAAATEKTADDQNTAYKAEEPAAQVDTELPDMVINGITYKAFPPKPAAEAAPAEVVVEEDAIEDMPMEEEPVEGGLTLSPEDLAAISEAIGAALQQAVATIMGGLDLEKKVAGHVQSFLAPMQATKDAADAETKQQVEKLSQQVADLTGDQPAVPYRPSQAKDNVLTDANLLAAAKQSQNGGGPFDDIIRGLGLARPQS